MSMILKCLGSSSKGNCYILESEKEALVIEAGVPIKEVKKALDFNVGKIVGCVVSHSHKDHEGYFSEYEKSGMYVFRPYDESKACPLTIDYGRFHIQSIRMTHDVPCYGFYITHPEMGTLVFATDTEYIKYRFKDVNHFLLEANYSDKYLPRDEAKRDRVMKTHMSIDTACGFLEKNKSGSLRNVVLLHLSDGSSNELEFVRQAKSVVGNEVNVVAADKGVQVDLSLAPF